MLTPSVAPPISESELATLLHPLEQSRFYIALAVISPIVLFGALLVLSSLGIFLFYLGVIAFVVWVTLRMLTLNLIANAVRVGPENFPEIHEMLVQVEQRLGYQQDVGVYVVDESGLNAILFKFMNSRFIILPAGLAADLSERENQNQLIWIIGRFIGALKAKHFRLQYVTIIIAGIEKLRFLNLFLYPYERAIQYSGDQIGLALCRDLDAAATALVKFMVGEKVANRVQLQGLLVQGQEIGSSTLAWLMGLLSAHPTLISRYLNLLAFARYKYPQSYAEYVLKFGNVPLQTMDIVLPRDFPIPAPAGYGPAPAPAGVAIALGRGSGIPS